MQPEFFGITDPEAAAWTRPKLNSHPWKCYTQPLELVDEAAVRALPRTDIDCTPNVRNWDDARRAESRHAARAWEIDTGHDLMITEPEKLAAMLLRLA